MDKPAPLTEALFYILLSLGEPNHGYGIIQQVAAITGNRVVLGPGTLYGAINAMLDKGWIALYKEEADARKKKEYLRTAAGAAVLAAEVERLKELLENAKHYSGDGGREYRA